MAKTLFTAIVADMRGKLAGTVFSKNKAGNYVRTKTSPTNPQTPDQTIVRQRLGSLSSSWRGLTEEQRGLWDAQAATMPRTNEFGQQYFLTGQQYFVSTNTNLATVSTSMAVVPLPPEGVPEFVVESVAADTTGPTVTLTLTGVVPTGFGLVIQATQQVSPGMSNLNNMFRQITVLAPGATSPADVHTAYSAKFGALVPGQKMAVRAYLVNLSTGESGVMSTASTIVTE